MHSSPARRLSGDDVAAAAQLACLLEASAPKPGNVSPGRHFSDLRYEDFLASAAAIGGPLAGADARPVGATVRLAIEATSRWTRSNSNLGIVLLFVPLARAALSGFDDLSAIALRGAVRTVLAATTLNDAREVYAAIRLARPGGLGQVDTQDVSREPDVTLIDAMRLAADRDDVAREYVSGFEVTFEAGVPALAEARSDGLSWDDAVVETFLTLLAARPDTHIARRAGPGPARYVSERAGSVMAAGGVRSARGQREIEAMDSELRDAAHSLNPGTTADLTAAAVFVGLLAGEWSPDPGAGSGQ